MLRMIKDNIKDALGKKVKDWFVKNERRVYITILKEDLKDVARLLYEDLGLRFCTASGIDNENNLEIIYHFSFDKTGEIFSLRVFIEDKNKPQVDSLTSIFSAASWIEREIHEMLGVDFVGHPNLKHLLLREDWPQCSFPLRKDYQDE